MLVELCAGQFTAKIRWDGLVSLFCIYSEKWSRSSCQKFCLIYHWMSSPPAEPGTQQALNNYMLKNEKSDTKKEGVINKCGKWFLFPNASFFLLRQGSAFQLPKEKIRRAWHFWEQGHHAQWRKYRERQMLHDLIYLWNSTSYPIEAENTMGALRGWRKGTEMRKYYSESINGGQRSGRAA